MGRERETVVLITPYLPPVPCEGSYTRKLALDLELCIVQNYQERQDTEQTSNHLCLRADCATRSGAREPPWG